MKNRILKCGLLTILALLLCASSLAGCKKDKDKDDDTAKKAEVVQLLGFESYEEFTGAKILIGNMLGEMTINTDKEYISQGKGSLQVKPQGDYSEQRKYPYFKLDFLNTTCATCDFTEFESIAFDVYNATDKELHVRASFSVGKDDGNYTTTIKTTYELKPNGWTTCTYDISEMSGYSYYDFMNVRYMTIEFMEHKQNKDDVPNELYIDNLVGNYYAKDAKEVNIEYDFWEGVTFENSADQYLVFGEDYVTNRTELSRATYEEEGLTTNAEIGEYGMKADATESIWPKFTVRLGEEVPENTLFTFMAYIQVDATDEDTFSFESSSPFGGNNIQHLVSISDTVFNEWFEVTIRTQTATDMISGFFNFDNFTDPITGHSRFGNKPVVIYLDNMKLSEYVDPLTLAPANPNFTKGITFEDEAEKYLVANNAVVAHQAMKLSRISWAEEGMKVGSAYGQYGMKGVVKGAAYPEMTISYKKEIPAGSLLTFMAYIKADASKIATVKTESPDNVDLSGSLPLNKWVEIQIELTEAQESTRMFFNFDDGTGNTAFGNDQVIIYFDNMKLELPAEPEGDFLKGIDFEVAGNAGLFVGAKETGLEWKDATISRVKYSSAGIPAPENGGTYALKLSHVHFGCPSFRINFGKELPAGTTLTFMAYGTVYEIKADPLNRFEYCGNDPAGTGTASSDFKLNEWTEITITLREATDYICLFWNYEIANPGVEQPGALYVDNFKAELPADPEGDFLKGVDFEIAGNAALFTGAKETGLEWKDATITRVKYSAAGISAPANGGTYALKLSHVHFGCPSFRINFGKELPKGTTLTFMAYGTVDEIKADPLNRFEYCGNNPTGTGTAAGDFKLNEWTEVTITLQEATDYICLFWNYEIANPGVEQPGALYVDNFKAELPAEAEGDFIKGVDFEVAGNAALFTGAKETGLEWKDATITRVKYSATDISAPANGGTYALKLSHVHFGCPSFKIDFGRELPAGTTLTFMAYGTTNEITAEPLCRFEYCETETAGTGSASSDFKLNEWTEVKITLTKATGSLSLFWNYEIANPGVEQPGALYVDNFKATLPIEPEGDFLEGVGFEVEGNISLMSSSNFELSRVKYADETMTVSEEYGTYAMKGDVTGTTYPTFALYYGETLPAGTTLDFWVYVKTDAAAAGDTTIRLERSKSQGWPEAFDNVGLNQWVKIRFTLDEATTKSEIFFNMDDGTGSSIFGQENVVVYLDDFIAELPAEGDFLEGVGFEVAGNKKLFTGWEEAGVEWADAVIERITYAEAGVSASTDGGDYVLKLSNEDFGCPRLTISFGETLPAGTSITFWAYGVVDGAATDARTRFIPSGISTGKAVVTSTEDTQESGLFTLGQWTQITITLSEAADSVQMFCDFDIVSSGSVGTMYVDNFKATLPPASFESGVAFENEADTTLLSSSYAEENKNMVLSRVKYADEFMTVAEEYGAYAIKGDVTGKVYPQFTLHYGEEIPADTKLEFWVYVKTDDSVAGDTTIKLERLKSQGWPEGFDNVGFNQWVKITFTLDEATSTSDIFFNLDDGTGSSVFGQETAIVYLDNFKVEVPKVNEFVTGVGFEVADHANLFAGWEVDGVLWADGVREVVTYESAGISAPTDGGTSALKLSHTTHAWPRFELNFGETLPAGTKLTFMAYGTVNGAATDARTRFEVDGVNKGKAVVTSTEDTQESGLFTVGTWTEITVTLSEETDVVQMFWNMDVAGSGTVGAVYVDNFKAVLP